MYFNDFFFCSGLFKGFRQGVEEGGFIVVICFFIYEFVGVDFVEDGVIRQSYYYYYREFVVFQEVVCYFVVFGLMRIFFKFLKKWFIFLRIIKQLYYIGKYNLMKVYFLIVIIRDVFLFNFCIGVKENWKFFVCQNLNF